MNTVISLEDLGTLNRAREWIALESNFAFVSNLSALVGKFLPTARNAFAGFTQRFSASDPAITLTRDQKRLLALVEKEKYLDLAPLQAYVPAGMHQSYLHYLNILTAAVDRVSIIENRVNQYANYLALIITNRDDRFSTKDGAAVYRKLEQERAQMYKDLGSCFKTGSHETRTRYDKVVDRNSDWKQIFVTLEAIDTKINSVNRKDLQKGVANVTELIDEFMKLVKDGHIDKATPTMLNELSDGAFQLASELEAFATTYYRVMAMNTAVNDTVTHVLKVFK